MLFLLYFKGKCYSQSIFWFWQSKWCITCLYNMLYRDYITLAVTTFGMTIVLPYSKWPNIMTYTRGVHGPGMYTRAALALHIRGLLIVQALIGPASRIPIHPNSEEAFSSISLSLTLFSQHVLFESPPLWAIFFYYFSAFF